MEFFIIYFDQQTIEHYWRIKFGKMSPNTSCLFHNKLYGKPSQNLGPRVDRCQNPSTKY